MYRDLAKLLMERDAAQAGALILGVEKVLFSIGSAEGSVSY